MRALSSPIFEEKQGAPEAPELMNLSRTPPLIQRAVADENTAETEAASGTTTEPETAAPEETPARGLIVEDDASEVAPGQMRKSEFLDELRATVCAAADAELAAAGRSTEGCPYIERAFERYRNFSGSKLERGLRRYAPETAGATAARDYIPAVSERVRRAVAVWAATGQITDVPEELASELSGGGLLGVFGGLLSGIGGAVSSLIGGIGGIFFKARDGSAKDADPREVRAQLGTGSLLDGGVRSRMESAFGHDFSRVRVHTDAKAAALSSQLRARAFTINSDIAFGVGEYQPGTLIGDTLLAHELAHVVQQGGSKMGSAMMAGPANNALEEDADASAVGAVLSLWTPSAKAGAVSKRAAREMTRARGLARSPRLRAGLRLQRCKDDQTSPKVPTTEPKVPTTEPKVPTTEPKVPTTDTTPADKGGPPKKPCSYTVNYAKPVEVDCETIWKASKKGPPPKDLCGKGAIFEITSVSASDPSCPLVGLEVSEKVATIRDGHSCSPPGFTWPLPIPCKIGAGGKLTGCTDTLSMCGPASDLKFGGCEENVKQEILVDGKTVETHTITFELDVQGSICTGTVTRK
jgi:hypothetical protein